MADGVIKATPRLIDLQIAAKALEIDAKRSARSVIWRQLLDADTELVDLENELDSMRAQKERLDRG